MSSRYNLSAGTGAPSTGASGPVGFGALKVPSASQRSCQRPSISAASVALYRNGGAASDSGEWVAAAPAAAPPALASFVARVCSTALSAVMLSSPRLHLIGSPHRAQKIPPAEQEGSPRHPVGSVCSLRPVGQRGR